MFLSKTFIRQEMGKLIPHLIRTYRLNRVSLCAYITFAKWVFTPSLQILNVELFSFSLQSHYPCFIKFLNHKLLKVRKIILGSFTVCWYVTLSSFSSQCWQLVPTRDGTLGSAVPVTLDWLQPCNHTHTSRAANTAAFILICQRTAFTASRFFQCVLEYMLIWVQEICFRLGVYSDI